MSQLSEPPAAPAAGQSTDPLTESVIQAAVNDVIRQTSYRDDTPVPEIGTAPPVPQPGIPPMSSKATDASVMMIAGGFLSLCLGTATSAILYFSGQADPVVVGCICAGPPVAFFSLRGLVKSLKGAAPDEIHNHYTGTVYQDQRNVHTSTRGVWAKTNNQQ
jgi:hypothetical protein